MLHCDSPYVVKYYGSYCKGSEFWIVMEYCGGGSVLDIMKLRKKAMTEDEISTILRDTLEGLVYLHERRKIHRDIKAGNILLNSEGNAKLADFGVAGQLTETMAKRNTVIGSPYWMAPEIIQEVGYNCQADIWSLGITAIEMAEQLPPLSDCHPMRAIFKIPHEEPPTLDPKKYSAPFVNFVSRCLVREPEKRATASQLLQHEFVTLASKAPAMSLQAIINEANMIREEYGPEWAFMAYDSNGGVANHDGDSSTMIPAADSSTLKVNNDGSDVTASNGHHHHGRHRHNAMPSSDSMATTTSNSTSTSKSGTDVESDLGTLIINSDDDEADERTLKPAFMAHFENQMQQHHQKSAALLQQSKPSALEPNQQQISSVMINHNLTYHNEPPYHNTPMPGAFDNRPHVTRTQITSETSGINRDQYTNAQQGSSESCDNDSSGGDLSTLRTFDTMEIFGNHQQPSMQHVVNYQQHNDYQQHIENQEQQQQYEPHDPYPYGPTDFRYLNVDQLKDRVSRLDLDMEDEIQELRRRYDSKRQPILDAIETKRKRQV